MNLFYNNSSPEGKASIAHVSYSDADGFGTDLGGDGGRVMFFAPRGIAYSPCEGDKLLMMPIDGINTCVGACVNTGGLLPGELRLTASGGAYVHLKSDGTISLNGLSISKNGVIL